MSYCVFMHSYASSSAQKQMRISKGSHTHLIPFESSVIPARILWDASWRISHTCTVLQTLSRALIGCDVSSHTKGFNHTVSSQQVMECHNTSMGQEFLGIHNLRAHIALHIACCSLQNNCQGTAPTVIHDVLVVKWSNVRGKPFGQPQLKYKLQ